MLLSEHATQIGEREWIDNYWRRTDANGLTILCLSRDDFTPAYQSFYKPGCQYCESKELHTGSLHDHEIWG